MFECYFPDYYKKSIHQADGRAPYTFLSKSRNLAMYPSYEKKMFGAICMLIRRDQQIDERMVNHGK